MSILLAQAQGFQEATAKDLEKGWGGLIFIGLFVLALIILGIWWLKRSA